MSPDLLESNYLGHSITWDKSGIQRAIQLLGTSQVIELILYIYNTAEVVIRRCIRICRWFAYPAGHGAITVGDRTPVQVATQSEFASGPSRIDVVSLYLW